MKIWWTYKWDALVPLNAPVWTLVILLLCNPNVPYDLLKSPPSGMAVNLLLFNALKYTQVKEDINMHSTKPFSYNILLMFFGSKGNSVSGFSSNFKAKNGWTMIQDWLFDIQIIKHCFITVICCSDNSCTFRLLIQILDSTLTLCSIYAGNMLGHYEFPGEKPIAYWWMFIFH